MVRELMSYAWQVAKGMAFLSSMKVGTLKTFNCCTKCRHNTRLHARLQISFLVMDLTPERYLGSPAPLAIDVLDFFILTRYSWVFVQPGTAKA